MSRFSDSHLIKVKDYLDYQLSKIDKLSKLIRKYYSWKPLPQEKEGIIYAVDGSRMMKRLSGAIVYAVSAVAIGRTFKQWHEIGVVSPYKYVDERMRIHMELLEKRIGAIVAEQDKADLILMDGTLSGALIRPPGYIEEIRREKQTWYDKHADDLKNITEVFLEYLEEHWESLKGELFKEEFILANTLLSRDRNIIEKIKSECQDNALLKTIENNTGDRENLIIYLEYVEYLHALDKLLNYDIAYIAKTFYTNDILRDVEIREKNDLERDGILVDLPDVPVIDNVSKGRGYLPFSYKTEKKKSLPKPLRDLPDKYLKNVREVLKDPALSKTISPAYVRFENNGVIYLLEVPTTNKRSFEETLSLILSVAEGEYVIPLEYAHHGVVIKKQEFDNYVDALINALVGEDERYLGFLRYGREPLE